jgi:hypothetical protein
VDWKLGPRVLVPVASRECFLEELFPPSMSGFGVDCLDLRGRMQGRNEVKMLELASLLAMEAESWPITKGRQNVQVTLMYIGQALILP